MSRFAPSDCFWSATHRRVRDPSGRSSVEMSGIEEKSFFGIRGLLAAGEHHELRGGVEKG